MIFVNKPPGTILYTYDFDIIGHNVCNLYKVTFKEQLGNRIIVFNGYYDWHLEPEMLFLTPEEAWEGLKLAALKERDNRIRGILEDIKSIVDGPMPEVLGLK
jgi:hypothetical protein